MKKYLLCANTSSGYVNFYSEEVKNLKRVYILTGVSEASASVIIKRLAAEFKADAIILSPVNIDFADGCIINGIGIFSERIKKHMPDDENYRGLYNAYGEAKKIHDDWEKIYIDNMDFEKLNAFCNETIEKILHDKQGSGRGIDQSRFFGASTPEKPVNFINNLTDDLKKRYFIKGRPGTGKSTFLKKLRQTAHEKGFDTETYYCSFDPQSLDMVIIRELSVCVFDSTAPHEMFPQKETDEILDFYTASGLWGVDEKFGQELDKIKEDYNKSIKQGLEYLKKIQSEEITAQVCENKEDIYTSLKGMLGLHI